MNLLGVAAALFLTAVTIRGGCGGKQAATPTPAEPATTPTPAAEPAPAPDGPNASPTSAAALVELEELRARACACSTPACERDVQLVFADFVQRHIDTVSTEQEDAEAGRIADAMMVCLDSLTSEEWAAGAGLAPCDAYILATERFVACDAIPPRSRAAVQQGHDDLRAIWNDNHDLPPEARRAAEDGCRAATEAVLDGATALGCAM